MTEDDGRITITIETYPVETDADVSSVKTPTEKIGIGILNPRPEYKMTYNIKNRDALLQQIAAGINQHTGSKVWLLEVTLELDDQVLLKTDLATVLDYLANDIYWNANSNWSEANIAKVRLM